MKVNTKLIKIIALNLLLATPNTFSLSSLNRFPLNTKNNFETLESRLLERGIKKENTYRKVLTGMPNVDVYDKEGEVYALIIGGASKEIDFSKTADLLYFKLLNAGLDSSKIYLLNTTLSDATPVFGKSNYENYQNAFSEIKKSITKNDVLFVLLETHGRTPDNNDLKYIKRAENIREKTGQSPEFPLPLISAAKLSNDDYISASNLKQHINDLTLNYYVVLNDFCFPYNFLEELSTEKGISLSTSTPYSKCYGTNFSFSFLDAFDKRLHLNTSPGDRNQDGKVTISEAFEYAAIKEELKHTKGYNNTPQIYWRNSNPDKLSPFD